MRASVIVVGLMLGVASTSAHADVDKSLLKPSFTATPAELLAAAKTAPPGDWPIGLLRQENQISFDDKGRSVSRWRLVFVVRSQGGADDWGTLSLDWQPFYQDKPTIRARVIEPGGKVTELDQSLIADSPAVETSPSVFSDRRRLEAPLPRLQIGAIVEEEVITRDRVPLLAAGTVNTTRVGGTLPIASAHFEFSAPANRKAKVIARGTPAGLKARHDISNGRETWAYDGALLTPTPEWEPFVPGDVVQNPYIGVSTAASWGAVARDYRKLLDQRISDGAFALPSHLPRTPTLESVRTIVAWLHQQVRYTGIEFGDASTIPWPPAETVKRGFGDCKDKATLLVAVLRNVGIRADLALLSTGPGIDLDVALPGMGVFDHAIVRAQIAGRDVWIDATEDLEPVGRLPSRDQRRRALIIANDTRDLVMTPASSASETVVRQVRTFALAESGAARVTEVSRDGGSYESYLRNWIRDARADDVRKELVTYAESEYGATALESYVTTPPADLGIPFELTLVAAASSEAFTERDRIVVNLLAADTLEKLPELLLKVDEKTTRKHDFELVRPHTFEIENRLIVPAGYTAPALTPERIRKLGTMTLTERQRADGNALIFTFTLVTGKHRLTPAELRTVQLALRDLGKGKTQVVIEHSGWAFMERGKPKEAIAEVRKLIAMHPKEAIHHTQLAFVLMRSGAGMAARAEARLAVNLQPTDADAHVVLGWALRHDSLGREYGFDHDRAGAIAALRKARKLDPKHGGAAIDLATVLERDARGVAFSDGADVKGAVEAWRAGYELDKTSEHANKLIVALMWSGQLVEAERFARSVPPDELRDGLLVSTVALARGGQAAINEATTLRTGLARSTLLQSVASVMMMMRRYELARVVFDHTASLQAGSAQATLVASLTRQTTKPGPSKAPMEVARNYFFVTMSAGPSGYLFWDDATREEFGDVDDAMKQQVTQLRQMGTGFVWDLASSSATIGKPEGRPQGPWRVEIESMGRPAVLYVALERDHARLIGESGHPQGLGRHALRLLANRDEVGARALLDWIQRDLDKAQIADRANHPFLRLWGPNLPTDKDAIALAAAVVARGTEQVVSIPVLDKCASKVAGARMSCDLPLAQAYLKGSRWKELDAHCAGWAQRDTSPSAKLATYYRAQALAKLGRLDEADKVAAQGLTAAPDEYLYISLHVDLLLARGRNDEAIERLVALTKRPGSQHGPKNNLAWLLASLGKDLKSAAATAQEAIRDSKDAGGVHNTLAAVLVELDDLHAGLKACLESMELGVRDVPAPEDWYVVGRLYEKLGFREDAVAAYKRLPPDKRDGFFPSSYKLARTRLEKLGVKSP